MEIELVTAAFGALGAVAGGGVAWGSARTRIRNVETAATDLMEDVEDHKAQDTRQHTEIVQRLARIETMLTQIDKRI